MEARESFLEEFNVEVVNFDEPGKWTGRREGVVGQDRLRFEAWLYHLAVTCLLVKSLQLSYGK